MSYDDRRIEVAKAAWRVIVREGLDRASMRAIAQELGSSTGVVTHYFRDKEELTLFALEQVFENVLEDMKTCAEGRQGIDRLVQMIFVALPLEDIDKADWKVWVAFLGYSIGRERLVQEHRKRYDFLRQIISQELADLQKALLIRADLDLTLEANALIALVDGIGTGVVIFPEQFSADQQKYLVRRHINAILASS
ncbi:MULTISPECIES: TetR/AcrR family transcriptional regulator [Nostoc]|jgi:AcrR family transcriptional regulator|uniref:TetR family transcriptional regulator n=1 Tax=Nostoc favosum CHAB5714 TaxID=2780399 RepID=A0ABS8IJS2_9NOSO|nr:MULTISPECIES: TetR/AcrR family transcriptional regulator [Nostoc]AVH68303.1 TetR family transcriptional regulator [Nostoc sp. 'Peltigera membranacea cyanobiont' N6]MCC5604018.1 TetR family transcriptional regulator [Nostoc favosum CHAB5714]MCW5318690.1 TetR family transcriptional regulator [Nostoc sp. KVJ3]